MSNLQPVLTPNTRSLWLQEALALEPGADDVEPLVGSHRTDICIIGGGYTGLWTALRLKELDPSIDVMLLEADICGSGASGRNGGLALGWWYKLPSLLKICGEEEALRLVKAASRAISEIGEFCEQNGVDAHFRQNGRLQTATTPLHAGSWKTAVETAERYGLDAYERLTPDEVAARGGSPVYVDGVFEKDAATVQPALLARGLRRVAMAKGVKVFEKTPVTTIDRGIPPVVRTSRAAVVAEKVILATNAWTASLRELRRHIIVVSSDMIATAPIPERLKEIGWTGGESISDSRLMVHYHQVTHDGRIAIGRGSGALAYLGRVTGAFNGNDAKAAVVEQGLRKIYPSLRDVPITHRWGGPIDRSRSGTLVFGRLGGNPRILYGIGYSGTGVAPSVVGGKILASTALDRVDEWSSSRLNQGPVLLYPPDPVRFFGGLAVRRVLTKKEEGEEDGIPASDFANRVSALAYPTLPRGLDRSSGSRQR
jgi:glycine/D-amino acid oxidase-like deaminating enzyme